MPMKKVRKLSGVALELTDPTARFRVNRVDSVAAGMHHNLGALPEEGGHANRAFSDDEDEDGKGIREEEEEARDAVAKELPAIRRMSSAYQGTITGMGGGTQYGGALVQMTREALPRLDNYRNLLSIASGRDKRPTLDELLSKDDLRKQSIQQDGGAGADGGAESSGTVKFGWVQGVMVRCMLNIWGVMLFLRLSWVVAQSGVGMGCVVILLSAVVTTLTALSMSAISTNGQVKAGGIYFMISRALGPEFGAAVGLIYSLACAVGTAMHTVGFAESVGDLLRSLGTQIVDGGKNDIRIIGVSAVVVMLCICLIGMSWEAKAQMGLLVILIIAIADFIIGAFVGPTSEEEIAKGFIGLNGTLLAHNFWPDYRENDGQMQSFFSIFAIFFPSATGILAGANISGDLKDPSSAIPKGTLLAIFITTISYIVFILLAGASVLRDATGNATEVTGWAFANCTGTQCHWGLHNSFQVMELVSIFGPLIYAGCFAATLSSALASLVSAPKVFQALCSDRLYPGLHWFAKGYGRSNEAYRSYALAFIIALAFILIAELNAIAPLISNFFLASYALVNFCTFHATLAKPIGWRPTFRYYNMWFSLAGFVLCVAIMFLMSWITAVITLSGLLGLYLMVMYRSPDVNWGSSTQAQTYTSAIKSLQRLNEVREHVKNYRPQVLVLSGRPSTRPPLMDLGHLLTRNVSLLVAGNVELDPLSHKARSAVVRSGNAWLRRHNIRAFVATVDGCGGGGCGGGDGGKGLDVGARALVQATGVGKMRPNVMLVGYKADWQTCPPRSLRQYFDVLLMALDHHLGLAVLRNGDYLDYRKILDDNNESAAIEAAVRSSTPAPPTPQATPSVPRRRKVTEEDEEDKGEEGDVEEEGEEEEEEDEEEEKKEEEQRKKEATQPVTKGHEGTVPVIRPPPETPAAKTNGAPPSTGNDVGLMEGGMLKFFKKGKEHEAEVYRGIGGAPLPNDILDRLTYFRRKQGKGVIDVWWLYDDGGLTLLLPYLINTRSNWAGCRLRVFALANSKDNLEMEQISIANLLSKFRIDYSDLTMIRDITQRPLDASKAFFASLIQNFRGRKTSGSASDDPSAENIISESELTAQREKTARHLRLRELLLENSKDSNLVVMTLPMPRRGAVSAPLYMAWMETLTRGMPPFLLVRGNQESVLTFYS
ncbi:bumetanide-sensitive sodium-(potassium)-chloride cotransporter-like [Ischnura elegans]|uniref:bumetanide-sensitive sodium-(potassium)-chloride cotransporter-like n=1 Tax=Ischnura elegans TaxID=197161 RepID=UPI001ED8A92B|nr:bumetanide-sensitive sodium-(potassium)-chloride cotransporter-like [Ischnura elegans]